MFDMTKTSTRERNNYTLESRRVIGLNGRKRSGTKLHVILIDKVIEDRDPKPGTFKLGDTFSAWSICGGNFGQHGAKEIKGATLEQVTCLNCQRKIGARWDD